VCVAKADVGHAAVDIVNDCMTLAGGSAYRDGTLLQRLLRDARAAHVMSPTTDLLYTWAGRALLGLPLLGE
jgi:alkylation response protein AidB-like acyl-CoA dehydrogenase